MGREIRRVPSDWQHPYCKEWGKRDQHQPLYDRSFKEAVTDWIAMFQEFLLENPTGVKVYANGKEYTFWEWENMPPDREWYRPEWTAEEATAYQVYENVSEGTPVSPVFQTQDEMKEWLMTEWKLSEQAADYFIQTGYAFSMIMTPNGATAPGAATIEAMARLDKKEEENNEH